MVKNSTAENYIPDSGNEDYVFGGWYTDAALTKPYDFSTLVTSDLTLYVKWVEANMNVVHFDLQGGVGNSTTVDQNVKNKKQATEPSINPTKTGVTFGGWYIYSYSEALNSYNNIYKNSPILLKN